MQNTMFERFAKIDRVLLFTVVLPTIVAIIYFVFLASDVYISESRFVVRSPDKPATSGLGVLLKSTGFTNGGDEIFAAESFIQSRDALAALNKGDAFRKAYDDPKISFVDRFNGGGMSDSFESLYKYYKGKISVDHESAASITTLSVRAFSPQEAYRVNSQLLSMAEATVNHLNERGRQDLIHFASVEVDEAKQKARTAALALSAFRNSEGVVDPEKQATAQLQMVSKLQDEIIAARSELLQLRSYTPQNPQIDVLATRVAGLEREMQNQVSMVAGGQKSLSSTAAQYQRLSLESQFADKQLGAAMTSLQDAANEARRKQAYLERIVEPSMPDQALEPRRFRGILSTLLLGIVAWGILTMLLAGVHEHKS
ncbi:capsular polysaccharide export protein [Sphingomonas sp. PAMC 26605]|uniref:capsular polysaccharide export protein n=1 Tax=Sphingomonas sp. PAMC 26605 TaxID=1112214 RepID=UPI00026CAB86|nr:capsular polysaccharide export protein [Sphingomonas sp. PAMC 26605]